MKTTNQLLIATVFALAFPLSIAAQTCVEPPSGLVSWWPAEGTAEDVAGDNDGALQGGAAFGTGFVGSAFVLDGFGDHITVADNPSLNAQRITIEGWVRTTVADSLFVAAKSGSSGLFGYEVGTHLSGIGRFLINGGADGADVLGAAILNNGLFHHIAATYDGNSLTLYVDGVFESRASVQPTIDYQPGSELLIGGREYSLVPGFWPGEIDELSVYSRALCGAEIEAIFNAGSSGKCFGGLVTGCAIFLDDFESGGAEMWSSTNP